jgi:hypothetical protein
LGHGLKGLTQVNVRIKIIIIIVLKPDLVDAIQPSKDPLEVPVGLVTRLRAKKFKEAFNGLLQDI